MYVMSNERTSNGQGQACSQQKRDKERDTVARLNNICVI